MRTAWAGASEVTISMKVGLDGATPGESGNEEDAAASAKLSSSCARLISACMTKSPKERLTIGSIVTQCNALTF